MVEACLHIRRRAWGIPNKDKALYYNPARIVGVKSE